MVIQWVGLEDFTEWMFDCIWLFEQEIWSDGWCSFCS